MFTISLKHQGILWYTASFGTVFLNRILEKTLMEGGQNPVACFLAGELLDFSAYILQRFRDRDEMEHASLLPCFSDLLKEKYLRSEGYGEEEGRVRYEEGKVFPTDLFYSFYYYFRQVALAHRGVLEQEVFPEFLPKTMAVLEGL